jgi:LysM repeat protein
MSTFTSVRHFNTVFLLLCGTLTFVLTGCQTTEIRQEQETQRTEIEALERKLNALRTDVVSVQSENEALQSEVNRLKEDLSASSELNQQYKSDIQRLDELVKKLDTAREQDRKIIIEEVGSEISRLSKKIQTATPPPPPKAREKPIVLEGVEHVVSKGETLHAIAKAYKVSVKEIQDANKLKSNSLKVGQKLFIPSK